MESAEDIFILILVIVNLALGFGLSFPLAQKLSEIFNKTEKVFRFYLLFTGIYFLECVAFAFGMGKQLFSIGLAFVWGIFFGLWFRKKASSSKILPTSFFLSFYTCLTTISFGILLVFAKLLGGGNLLSAKEGIAFGISEFVPYPLNTILGFCTALVVGTVVLKTAITTGGIWLLLHLKEKSLAQNIKPSL